MNKAIRWRIISLQAMLVIILASASGFLFYEGSFVTGMVHDQLVAQRIFFPGTDQVKAGGALDPAKFPVEVTQYAGTQVDNADKAKAYGNGFIGEHLKGIAGGMTYSEVSAAASVAAKKAASADKSDAGYAALQADSAKLAGQKTSLFMGETLRGNLLNAWGWGTMGAYTTFAGIGLMLASLVVLGALVFELVIVGRKESLEVKVARAVTA